MQKLTIIIPTRKRLGKLLRLLASIPRAEYLRVFVGVDGDHWTAQSLSHPLGAPVDMPASEMEKVAGFYPPDLIVFSPKHRGSMAICNLLSALVDRGGLLQVCDDMEFLPRAIETAMRVFSEEFPDDDGVLGFHQEGLSSYSPGGVFLMGERFLDRYPGQRIFYQGYWHFGDSEVMRLAERIGRFHFCREAVVYHHHPASHPNEVDMTHQDARRKKEEDQKLSKERQERGEVWGDTCAPEFPPKNRMIEKPPEKK